MRGNWLREGRFSNRIDIHEEVRKMKVLRKIIEIDEDLCNGCGECVPSCAEGALQIVDGKARLVAEIYCDGLGACLGECPTGALRIIEREAEDFDVEAVEEYLQKKEASEKAEPVMHAGCPSSRLQMFHTTCEEANRPASHQAAASELSHWPVQIRLVPPAAPFLRDAHLLVAADCTPFAYPNFHGEFLKDKALMIGCPKFDDVQDYVRKFAEVFSSANIKSVTVVEMEVPCCARLPLIVKKGMELAGKRIPMEEVVISTQGGILKRARTAA
jgi:ferredoxin